MPLQTSSLRTRIRTLFTSKGFLSGMSPHMCLQFPRLRRENYNLLLPLARFGQLAKCVQCYIGQICPSIHWTDLAIDKWHNMSTHRKDLILLFLLPSSFSPPPPPLPSLSLTCYMLQWLVYSITLHTLYYTWLPLCWVRFEPMTLGCGAAALTNRPQSRSHSHTIKWFYLCQIGSICY